MQGNANVKILIIIKLFFFNMVDFFSLFLSKINTVIYADNRQLVFGTYTREQKKWAKIEFYNLLHKTLHYTKCN